MKRRFRSLTVLNAAFWVVVVVAVLSYVVPEWRHLNIADRLRVARGPWLAAGFALLLIQYLISFSLWVYILRQFSSRQGRTGALFRAFGLSLLTKYIPGKVLGQGIRVKLAADTGVPVRAAITSLSWEIGLCLASAAFVAWMGLVAGDAQGLEGPTSWMLRVFVVLTLLGVILLCLPRWGRRWREWLEVPTARRHPVVILVLVGGYTFAWMILTLAHWCIARAIGTMPSGHIRSLLVALCVAWGAGMMSVIAPAGLGVREGVLFLFARDWLGSANALLFVSLSRVLILAAEACLTGVAALPWLPRSPASDRIHHDVQLTSADAQSGEGSN